MLVIGYLGDRVPRYLGDLARNNFAFVLPAQTWPSWEGKKVHPFEENIGWETRMNKTDPRLNQIQMMHMKKMKSNTHDLPKCTTSSQSYFLQDSQKT
jgi:hypothetical protein